MCFNFTIRRLRKVKVYIFDRVLISENQRPFMLSHKYRCHGCSLTLTAASARTGCCSSSSHVWLGFEYLQEWRPHWLFVQPISLFHHPHSKKKFFLLIISCCCLSVWEVLEGIQGYYVCAGEVVPDLQENEAKDTEQSYCESSSSKRIQSFTVINDPCLSIGRKHRTYRRSMSVS